MQHVQEVGRHSLRVAERNHEKEGCSAGILDVQHFAGLQPAKALACGAFPGQRVTTLEAGNAAAQAGYRTRPTAKSDGVILETETAVDASSFARHAAQMQKWTGEFGCEYDSWECQLVKR